MITITLGLKPTPDEITVARGVIRVLERSTLGESLREPEPAASTVAVAATTAEDATAATDVPAADSTGLPWDDRIHSSTKGRNNDGTWKKRRGVQDATVTAVEAELRARAGAPVVQTAPPPPPAPPATVTTPAAPPPPPPAVAVSPTTGSDEITTFPAFMSKKVTPLMASGQISKDQIVSVCAQAGLTNGLPGLAARPDLIPTVVALIDATLL